MAALNRSDRLDDTFDDRSGSERSDCTDLSDDEGDDCMDLGTDIDRVSSESEISGDEIDTFV